jgi:hypothetical protein
MVTCWNRSIRGRNILIPPYRDRAVRLEHDDNGWEVLMFDNKPLNIIRGTLGALGGVGSDAAEAEAFFTPGKRTYAQGCPPDSYAAKPRLPPRGAIITTEPVPLRKIYTFIGPGEALPHPGYDLRPLVVVRSFFLRWSYS